MRLRLELGLSIKDVRSQGRGSVFSADNLQKRGNAGSSDADVCTFWCKKLRIFRNLWFVHTDKGEGDSVRTDSFRTKGVNFCDFVRTSFLDGSLAEVR